MRSGEPARSGQAEASVSPSAAAGTARSAVTVTQAARCVVTSSISTCVPRPARSIASTNDSFVPWRTMITSSSPSLTSASGATCLPAAR
jgi:hypothetical protein